MAGIKVITKAERMAKQLEMQKAKDGQLKEQFRILARAMVTIEDTVQAEGKIPVKSVDLFVDAIGLTKAGEALLLSMLLQSDKVEISEDQHWILPKMVFRTREEKLLS